MKKRNYIHVTKELKMKVINFIHRTAESLQKAFELLRRRYRVVRIQRTLRNGLYEGWFLCGL